MDKTTFTQGMADVLDRMNPAALVGKLGTLLFEAFTRVLSLETSSLQMIEIPITADAKTAAISVVLSATESVRIIDAFARCTAANASGTLLVSDSAAAAITSAMVCAVDKAIGRTTSVDPAKATVAAGGTVKITANGVADRGVIVLSVIKG